MTQLKRTNSACAAASHVGARLPLQKHPNRPWRVQKFIHTHATDAHLAACGH